MASEPRRRGLLVDYGGVLTTNLFDSFREFCEAEGLEPEEIGRRFRHDPRSRELLVALEEGRLGEDDFEQQFGAVLGVDGSGLIARLFAGSRQEPTMVEAVARARGGGIATGLISNSWGTSRYDRGQLADLFDAVVISGEIGIRKPAPEIYELGAQRLGLGPSQCVFVDDLPFNLEPATELGMATVHHTDPEETIAELETLLGVPLR